MKKVFAILVVLALVAGFAFATDPVSPAGAQRITVQAVVERELPTLVMYGANTTFDDGAVVADTVTATVLSAETAEPATLATEHNGEDILDTSARLDMANVVAYFKIRQTNNANCYFVYSLAVVAAPFKAIDNGVSYTSSNPTIALEENLPADATYLDISAPTASGTSLTLTATYTGAVTAQDITYFNVTWPQDNDAPNATYQADVTLTYTAE